ncbi:MAG: aminoacyl-tRNA hydrolase [Oscillospiraceae bacterium]
MLLGKFGGGSVSWLLVCLGNPGREYAETRHNVGFLAADLLSREKGVKVERLKFRALTGTVTLGGEKVLVMKPQTFMNLSGEAVGQAARFYKLPPQRVLVIQDDVALPLGKLRIRANGSAGGHNGLKSIIAHLGSEEFPRIKVGVGAPQHPEHEMVDWVIGKFTPAERKVLDQALQRAVDAAECVIREGVQKAQNRYN